MTGDAQEQSSAMRVLFGELLRHRSLAIRTLVVSVLDAGLVFGVSPYIVSLFAERIANEQIQGMFHQLALSVALIAIVHAVLFFLRVRWRRTLSALGRTGLSERLNGAVVRTDVNTSRKAGSMQGETQKMQEAWIDLTFNLTEVFIPFVCGSVCLIVFVAVRAPLFIVPIMVLVAGGVAVAWKSAIDFNAKNRLLSAAATRERGMFDAMFAVPRMKWLITKLSPIRAMASNEYEGVFGEQAKTNARWQSILLMLGGFLQFAAISGGPALIGMGYAPSVAVLIVLLGYALGDKFVSITSMLCMYDWILFRAKPIAAFVEDVETRSATPRLPDDALQESTKYVFRGVTAVYENGQRVKRVPLPDMTIWSGTTILTGRSGVGKSTLLGVADGSISYEGSVLLGGFEVRDWDVSGKIVNGSQSFGEMDVSLERLLGGDEKARDLALQCAAYPEAELGKSVGELSGGQRQRAMLAAIIYHTITGGFDDSVLFVDEPTTGLGAREIRRLIAGFRQLTERLPNLALVITTHEKRLLRLAEQLVVLREAGGPLIKRRDDQGNLVRLTADGVLAP